jgi:hypothetical protein
MVNKEPQVFFMTNKEFTQTNPLGKQLSNRSLNQLPKHTNSQNECSRLQHLETWSEIPKRRIPQNVAWQEWKLFRNQNLEIVRGKFFTLILYPNKLFDNSMFSLTTKSQLCALFFSLS